MNSFYRYIVSTLCLLILLLPTFSFASEVQIRPFLIDKTVPPRGVASDTVVIKNEYDYRKLVLFATVNEISVNQEGEIKEFISPIMSDRTDTVTSWINITRGRIEVEPSSTKEVPVTIKVDPFAKPGVYHAFIGLVQAKNRPAAEAIAMSGDARGVVVKVTIADQREDSMKIAAFLVNRFITGEDKKNINIKIENIGDIESAPEGEVIFYNSRGEEVASAPVNTGELKVTPGGEQTITTTVPDSILSEIGRYKAKLSLKYGENQAGLLYDTATFYMMPWHILLFIFIAVLLVAIIFTLLLRRHLGQEAEPDDYHEVTMYVRDGHITEPSEHDIDLKKND